MYYWEKFTDEELLDLKLSDLGLRLEDSWVSPLLSKLNQELRAKSLSFRPHFWISDEWYCPDGIPGMALPFFALHPRLIQLERKMMGHGEGCTELSFMKLLRHECGHAIDNAFFLRDEQKRVELFGSSDQDYPDSYTYRPYSRAYVRHLGEGYAQAHPDEDWAETFALWLTPRSNWRVKYKDWGAITKLEHLNRMMRDLKGVKPRVQSKETIDELAQLGTTLRKYYQKKTLSKRVRGQNFFGGKLRNIFSPEGKMAGEIVLKKKKKVLKKIVARKTGLYQYEVEPMLRDLLKEARSTGLYLKPGRKKVDLELTNLLIQESARFKRQGRDRVIM